MAKTQRYKPVLPWSIEQVWDVESANVTVILEVADLKERHTGRTHVNGAFHVRFEGENPRPRAKLFYGESAWADGRRYAEDSVNELKRR